MLNAYQSFIYIIYVLFIITNQLKVMFNQQQAVDSLLQYEEERREVKSQMSFSQNNFIQSEEIRQWDKNFENIDFMRRFSMQQITMLNLKKVSTKIDVKDVNNKDILVLSAEKQSRTNKNFYIRPKKTTRQREQYCISPQILIHNHRKDKKYSKEQHRVSSFVKEVKPQKEINQKPFFRVYNYPNKKPANINITNFPFSIPIHDNIDNEMKLNSQRQKYQSLMKKIHLCLNKRVQEQSLIEEKKMSIIPHLKAKKLKANYIKRRQLLL